MLSLPLSQGMVGIPISYLGHVRYSIVAFPSLYAIREYKLTPALLTKFTPQMNIPLFPVPGNTARPQEHYHQHG